MAARLLGSTTSGVLELIILHPFDTVARRLMTNINKLCATSSIAYQYTNLQVTSIHDLSNVIFCDASEKPLIQRYRSSFPGLGFAAGYKVSQRIYKFGGQPIVKDYMANHHKKPLET